MTPQQQRSADLAAMAFLLVGALLLRLGVAAAWPSLHHPDENFQVFEQAHRLAFGYGIVPWEFERGMRSMLLPWLMSRLLLLMPQAEPQTMIFAQRVVLSVASLLPVAAAYAWGRAHGRAQAIVLALVAATWFELVYFAARPLTDAIAAHVLVAAIALAYRAEARPDARGFVLVGALLGLCVVLRMHLAVGVAAVVLLLCAGAHRQRWRPLLAGAVIPVLPFALADWLAWGVPFHSQWAAVRVNVFEGQASNFGRSPLHAYVEVAWTFWGGAFAVLLLLALARARDNRLWLAAALGILVSHSLIPHKEYRFVTAALACIVMAAAWTSAQRLQRADSPGSQAPRRPWLWPAGVACAWLATSLALATSPAFRGEWFARRQAIETAYWLHGQRDLCGLLLHGVGWWNTGGYAHLHRNVPMYAHIDDAQARRAAAPAYSHMLLRREAAEAVVEPYRLAGCAGPGARDDLCIAVRPGPCVQEGAPTPLTQRGGLDGVRDARPTAPAAPQ